MQDAPGAPGGRWVRRDGPPEKIAVRTAAPAVSIELKEDWTGRWYIFRDRSDDLEQVEGVSTPTAPLMSALGHKQTSGLSSAMSARHLHFANDLAPGLLDRNVQSGKMLHAALLLLMLEAITTDLVSPSA
jgi:hypothetical protein